MILNYQGLTVSEIAELRNSLREVNSDVKVYKNTLMNIALKNKNIDYLALGHIHGYKEAPLDGRGKYCYPGCLEGRGFDECGKKGFVLLNIENY